MGLTIGLAIFALVMFCLALLSNNFAEEHKKH